LPLATAEIVAGFGVTRTATVPVTGAFFPSLAVNVGVELPVPVGVPETVPVRLPLSVKASPAGSPLALKVIVSPASASVAEMLKVSGLPY
jgi:hypothetical protein